MPKFRRATPPNSEVISAPLLQWTTSSLEVYQHLLETHFPGRKNESESRSSQETNDMRWHKSRWLSSRSLDILAEIVTVDRIKWAISTMSPFKSPGRDGIFPVLLQKGIHYLAKYLQSISASGIYTQVMAYCSSCICP